MLGTTFILRGSMWQIEKNDYYIKMIKSVQYTGLKRQNYLQYLQYIIYISS